MATATKAGWILPKLEKFTIPKKLGAVADELYTLRQRRLELQKVVDELESREKALKEHVINNLPKSDAKGISGSVANVRVENDEIPQVKDWDKFYAYVKKTNAFDLLQRRLNPKAVTDRWADKKKVPGVESFTVTKVSCTKV